MTTRWSVPAEWQGETVAILASGPSMSFSVAAHLRGRCRVIAVNNQGIPTREGDVLHQPLAPWADVLYAADAKWWHAYRDAALAFRGRKVTIRHVLPFDEVLSLELSNQQPFDERPTHLTSGGNSGYQALCLAVHFGAARVLLCGYDMQDVGGKKHWFGDHAGPLNTPPRYKHWIANFARLAPVLKARGVDVINCTPNSALTCFPRIPLSEVLA